MGVLKIYLCKNRPNALLFHVSRILIVESCKRVRVFLETLTALLESSRSPTSDLVNYKECPGVLVDARPVRGVKKIKKHIFLMI